MKPPRSFRLLFLVFAVLVLPFFSCPGEAQYPRPSRHPVSSFEIANHLTKTRFTRIVIVDSAGGGDYKKISEALAFVASKNSSERNWTSRWTVLVYPGQRGSADPDTYGYNYSETALTIPAYTEVMGFATGHNHPIAWMGGAPVVELSATSGTLIRLGGGSSLTNLHFVWLQTPTAAVKALDHAPVPDADSRNHNVPYIGQLTNVSFNLLSRNSTLQVDGITETSGGLIVKGGGVLMDGSAAGRTVVNASSVDGLGVTVQGGRYGGSSGCAALMASTGVGALKLFAGVRLDPGCTNDLVRTGAGAIEVQGGIGYGPVSGVITPGPLHLPFGIANPATCSPGAAFLNTGIPGVGAEKLCACIAANTWRCSALVP